VTAQRTAADPTPREAVPPGRRERKKAATRAAIADAAVRLFLEHGYDQVSMKQVAERADVALTTVFKHFPGKEALVFDEDAQVEDALVHAVLDRDHETTILDSLHRYLLTTRIFTSVDDPHFTRFRRLVETTPALDNYWRQMWMRHGDALAGALTQADPGSLTPAAARSLAHTILDSVDTSRRSDNPRHAIAEIFALIKKGWNN
jgi:AcrR family transcriptional regulator